MQINTLSLVCRELVTGTIPFFILVDHVYSFIVVLHHCPRLPEVLSIHKHV